MLEKKKGIFVHSHQTSKLGLMDQSQGVKPPSYDSYLQEGSIASKLTQLNTSDKIYGAMPKFPQTLPDHVKNPLLNTHSDFFT